MALKLSSLRADLKLESEGDWVPAVDLPGIELRVRSVNYPAYQNALVALGRRWAKRYPDERVPEDISARDLGGAIAEHLLLEWRGFDVEYSQEEAAAALADPAQRQLREAVLGAANKVGRQNFDFIKEAAGN